MELCRGLKDSQMRLADLDAAALLEEMERMEQEGTTFQNKQVGDAKSSRYAASVLAALAMILLMVAVMALMAWGFAADSANSPPLALVVVLTAVPGLVILGVLLALKERVREIGKGEIDDARYY